MKNITKKLIAVMAECESVEKDGYNDFQKYNYIKEEDVTSLLRKLLVKNSLFITHSVLKSNVQRIEVGNKPTLLTEVHVEYNILDADSGETLKLQSFGQGVDTGDKGIYKALTGAHKYFLLKNFNLSSGDDPEKEEKTNVENSKLPEVMDKRHFSPNTINVVSGLATEKQRKFIYAKFKEKGIGEFDYLLKEKFSFTLKEMPFDMVNKVVTFVNGLKTLPINQPISPTEDIQF